MQRTGDKGPMKSETIKYYLKDIPNLPSHEFKKSKCEIIVCEGDCFRAASMYKNSVIHNFANNTRPGGPTSVFDENGILKHQHIKSNTQEDQIIRIYGKNLLLYPKLYPIIDESKENSEALLYSICESAVNLPCVITLPAPIEPNFKNKKTIKTIINRIKLMLYIAHKYSHTLITGMWGCGAFACDPKEMIELWKYAIKTSDYVPDKIVFSILIDEYSRKWGQVSDIMDQFNAISQ